MSSYSSSLIASALGGAVCTVAYVHVCAHAFLGVCPEMVASCSLHGIFRLLSICFVHGNKNSFRV